MTPEIILAGMIVATIILVTVAGLKLARVNKAVFDAESDEELRWL